MLSHLSMLSARGVQSSAFVVLPYTSAVRCFKADQTDKLLWFLSPWYSLILTGDVYYFCVVPEGKIGIILDLLPQYA